MSLEKAIEHGKEKRKPYYRSQRFDRSCRNHGGCPYCESNRLHKSKVKEDAAKQQLENLYEEILTMTTDEYNDLFEEVNSGN